MKRKDLFLALLVVTVWGANFTVIKLGLSGVPPMLLVALRYTFTALSGIIFIKPPSIKFRYLLAYGLTVGVGQFSCLFYAMDIGMPAGVASVLLQCQIFFTLFFAAIFLKERIKGTQILGLIIAASGLYLIARNAHTEGLSSIPLEAFVLTLMGAAFWGLSNIVVRQASDISASKGQKLDMLGLVVWSSLVPPIPFLALALVLDTPQTLMASLSHLNALSVFAVLYLAFCATIFGYGTWSGLLGRYPAGKIAPLSLLVPITGLITSHIVLSEQLSQIQWLGALFILFGLIISNFEPSSLYIFKSKDI